MLQSPEEDRRMGLHDRHGAYPAFMATYHTTEAPDELYPSDYDAAAELAVAMLKYGHTDFARPTTYELVNEPHWSYMTEPEHLAKWHLAVLKAVRETTPDVLVGGPCNSVGYLYSQDYRSLTGIRNFIDATRLSAVSIGLWKRNL